MRISIVNFLQILFVAITIIHGDDTFDCTGYEDDSYHPIFDADDCRHYWHCIYVNTVYMHAVKRSCPAGTEFDTELRQCETANLVNCVLVRSPHIPRTTSTTQAWKWRYSKLFSRINWKPTIPYYVTTRRHPVFDLGDLSDIERTTMIMQEAETTQVLPFTLPKLTTVFSLEQLSKNLHALVLDRHPHQHKPSGAKFFQPGEPENEAEVYTSTTIQRTRRTHYTTQSTPIQTTTQIPLTTLLFTMEITTTTIVPTTSTILTTISITTTTDTSSLTSTLITTMINQSDPPININPQARMGGQHRRTNMTLYILTSDEHKIRQFSVNHTRGILVNCNQLRRRLLGRRRLRDTLQTTNTHKSLMIKNSSNSLIQTFQYNILLLTILSLFFLQK